MKMTQTISNMAKTGMPGTGGQISLDLLDVKALSIEAL